MVRTRVGVIARVLAIAALLGVNAVVGVRAAGDCYSCPIDGVCLQVSQGHGNTDCIEIGGSCFFDGDSCTVE
jgi:hypothetical protein